MSDSRYSRRPAFRQAKEEVLVVCGGQTEELYFRAFNKKFHPSLGKISIVTAVEARSPVQIVDYAIRARRQNNDYNAIWCVFDKDDFFDFDEAIEYARRNNIGAAFSNQAFEVWFINHFRLLDSPLHRSKFKEALSRHLPFSYDKDEGTVAKVCDTLLTEEKLITAMTNARLDTSNIKLTAYQPNRQLMNLVQQFTNWQKAC